MLILDTNVLSEIMGPRPAPEVAAWMARQPDDLLITTAISQAEILSGLAIMPEGRRRRELESAACGIFTEDFEGRILPFDTDATAAYAEVVAARRRTGRATAPLDLMIAAVAVSHNASVVTRDTKGFEGCGLTLVNPWQVS
ncbi:type II toxin-antitoxin system VapC family toxin [Acidiphilium acidophilum]|uniref:type II toxin-antitoxin system VapC family toxin n=1 Tax=Acidiphilium acidophilum TaxID=76588 RepID=UPI002E8E670D|nr:type II toxin-antitoxin system VapC family toxin [Acidiphilium acidophilum]